MEIKFRGKLCHSDEWIVGNLIIANNNQPYIVPSDCVEPDGHHLIFDDKAFWVIPETVGQFTGLTDKNGKEIFEDSDLMLMKFTIQVDSFKECSYIETADDGSCRYKKIIKLPSVLTKRDVKCGYEFYNKEYDVYTPLWSKSYDDINNLEVIGNIHDNGTN